MTRRTTLALAATAALGASALATGTASARTVKETIRGKATLNINHFVQDSQHWGVPLLVVHKGDTIRVTNRSKTQDPHTFSLVKKSQVPHTLAKVFNCDACNQILGQHFPDPNGAPVPTVNVGAAGFDQPGDSQLINQPKKPGSTVSFKVTATKGTTLHFLCAIHPWMQGKIVVK